MCLSFLFFFLYVNCWWLNWGVEVFVIVVFGELVDLTYIHKFSINVKLY